MSGPESGSVDEVAELRRLLVEERRTFMRDLEESATLVQDTRAQLARIRSERNRAQARVERLLAQRDRLRGTRDELEAELADSLVRESRAVRLTARLVRRVRRVGR